MTRLVLLAALWAFLALVSACAPQRSSMSTAQSGMIPPSAAYILPDPGGPVVVGAVQRNLGNAVEHEVLLGARSSTPGQNALTAQVFGRAHQVGNGAVDPGQPTNSSVRLEMEKVLPSVSMTVSPYFVQNRYGPFGYAMGRGRGRDLCIYGWQRLNMQSGAGPFYANRFLIQIRLRLCQSGASENELLQVMYRFTLSSYFGSQYPDVPPQNPRDPVSVLDSPTVVRPSTSTGMASVLPDYAPSTTVPPRAAAKTAGASQAKQVSTTAAYKGPTVPSPVSSGMVSTALSPSPINYGDSAPIVPPPDFGIAAVDPSSQSMVAPNDPNSPAMRAITAAREIELPDFLAREAKE